MDAGPILAAAEYWKAHALLHDGSVLSDGAVWTPENLEALDKYFIQNPDAGEGSFFEKLESQIDSTGPGAKQLAAELLWLMFLCPSNIGAEKKREGVRTIWEWSGAPFPGDSQWLEDDVLRGVGSAGTGYNTKRWREFVFCIRIMIAFKELSTHERAQLLGDGWGMAQWLEQIPECDARQFRHMVLFLLFPDDFDRIFGGTDRREIVRAFIGKTRVQVNSLSALEVDRELSAIRERQAAEVGTEDLDFYEPPLRDIWKGGKGRTWLFTWNPESWPWESMADDRAKTHAGSTVTHRWACTNRSVKTGDKAYMKKVGKPPRGIMAVGNIVTETYEAPHWEEKSAAEGKIIWYVDIAFSRIQDPLSKDPYITQDDLKKIASDKQDWSPQSSGIEIKPRSAGVLETLWDKVIGGQVGPGPEPPSVGEAVNQIFYGPPGTGKTYRLAKLREQYSSEQQVVDRNVWLAEQVRDVKWFDVVFMALHALGGKGKVADIVRQDIFQAKLRALGRTRHKNQTAWATLQSHAREDSATVKYGKRQAPLVFDKDESSVWRLVDEWEEECEDQIALSAELSAGPSAGTTERRYEFVTFHQAYSYEDFVEGIRPVQDDDSGELSYQVVPGLFQRICNRAKVDPAHRYAIFIDEINRGNIAKIFGELITLIEPDKRAVYVDGYCTGGMELTLPYSGAAFGVPANLDVYGAMNTADRSIALLDTALRRRFRFRELMPDAGLINGSRGDGYIEDGDGGVINLRALLEATNRRIRFLLNRDLTLGHSYLMPVRDFHDLKTVLLDQLIPLLQEYFYEDWHRIQLVFRDVGAAGEKLEPQIICHETLSELEVLGFDHDNFTDETEYFVAGPDDITPDAIRKVYEDGG